MQKLRSLSFFLILVALLSGCRDSDEKPAEKETPKSDAPQLSHNTNGEAVLKISPELQERIALVVKAVEVTEQSPELKGYGFVMDPTPLVAAQGEMAATAASLESLKIMADRARGLFEKGEMVSRKSVEAAESDLRMAEIKLHTAKRLLALDWGETIAKMDNAQLGKFVEALVSKQTLLIRIDLPAGDKVEGLPVSSRVSSLVNEHWEKASIISEAPKANPGIQSQGFILSIANSASGLRPGLAVSAFLQLSGTAIKGVIIPLSAILRTEGKTWVEVQSAQDEFTRREVTLETPTQEGWFTTTGFSPGEKIVIEPVQMLLSEEQKSRLSAD